ncbi:MAG TPA: cation:proton antiporter regulatory subunit [Actinomycetota bacterium]|nr:cation:proton antiporter regulatory subunit [Actinomycetota bacterium]
MAEVSETKLPGMGVRYEFVTSAGERVGVVHHRTGRREVVVFDKADPDACREVVRLDEDDSRTLAELLGSSRIVEELTELQQGIEGLAIDWLPVVEGTPFVGKPISATRARTRTGASIVAVLREDGAHPAPGPDFLLSAGDTLVVVGTPRGIEELAVILRTG